MRHLIKFALLAGAALAVSGCNRGAPATNNAANEIPDNGSLATPGNDASTVESLGNAPAPVRETNAVNTVAPETAPPPPSTPNVESNVAGM